MQTNNPFENEKTKAFAQAIARLLHKIFNVRGVDPAEMEKHIDCEINHFLTEKSDMSVVDFWRIIYSLRCHITISPGELIFENCLPQTVFEKEGDLFNDPKIEH